MMNLFWVCRRLVYPQGNYLAAGQQVDRRRVFHLVLYTSSMMNSEVLVFLSKVQSSYTTAIPNKLPLPSANPLCPTEINFVINLFCIAVLASTYKFISLKILIFSYYLCIQDTLSSRSRAWPRGCIFSL